jgi:hypothetical protein
MQDQTTREPPRSLERIEEELLWLLLRPTRCGPWHTWELALQIGDPEQSALALAGLHADGLVHISGEFAHATHAAGRFYDLTASFYRNHPKTA